MSTVEERLQLLIGRIVVENVVLQLRAEAAEAKLAEALAQRDGAPVPS